MKHVLAVPATRYSEFHDRILALAAAHDQTDALADDMGWQRKDTPDMKLPLLIA